LRRATLTSRARAHNAERSDTRVEAKAHDGASGEQEGEAENAEVIGVEELARARFRAIVVRAATEDLPALVEKARAAGNDAHAEIAESELQTRPEAS
jgi:hypothetical protein